MRLVTLRDRRRCYSPSSRTERGPGSRAGALPSLGVWRDTARTISQENVEVVKRAIAAVNERDIDGYLAACTPDVELRTPAAPIGGVYEGSDGIRRFFADIQDTSPDFRLELERAEEIGADQVLAFLHVTSTGRVSGVPAAAGIPTTNVYDLVKGKIRRIRIFIDRHEALEAVGLSE